MTSGTRLGIAALLVATIVGPPRASADVPAPHSVEGLARMSWGELECLYRQAEAGTIPAGYTRGRAIYCRGRLLSGAQSATSRLLWRGKHFDPCAGTLVNQWRGFRAVRARVGCGTSWLDGRPSIVMDYRGTSRFWPDVRDEAREVAPGLYLGIMYREKCGRPELKTFFALELCPQTD